MPPLIAVSSQENSRVRQQQNGDPVVARLDAEIVPEMVGAGGLQWCVEGNGWSRGTGRKVGDLKDAVPAKNNEAKSL